MQSGEDLCLAGQVAEEVHGPLVGAIDVEQAASPQRETSASYLFVGHFEGIADASIRTLVRAGVRPAGDLDED